MTDFLDDDYEYDDYYNHLEEDNKIKKVDRKPSETNSDYALVFLYCFSGGKDSVQKVKDKTSYHNLSPTFKTNITSISNPTSTPTAFNIPSTTSYIITNTTTTTMTNTSYTSTTTTTTTTSNNKSTSSSTMELKENFSKDTNMKADKIGISITQVSKFTPKGNTYEKENLWKVSQKITNITSEVARMEPVRK